MRMTTQDTSREAKEHLEKRDLIRKNAKRVLDYMENSDGKTCDECEIGLNMSHQTCSSRITWLKIRGCLADSGARRKTRSGRNAIVWIVYKPMPDREQKDLFKKE